MNCSNFFCPFYSEPDHANCAILLEQPLLKCAGRKRATKLNKMLKAGEVDGVRRVKELKQLTIGE
ncbi:MAG: hypothetical protein GY861_14575 [bacterium]|nr:hypothetical protein [bacterium]